MEYQSSQFVNPVTHAITLITQLVLEKRSRCGGTNAAIRTVAQDCQISTAQVRRLFQPSRHPKEIGAGLWLRISSAYRRHLQREIARLEADLRRLYALGNIDPGTVQDLRVEAEALIARLKQHL